ncbi:Phospholipase D/Transphosphatidylase domain-containing protein [Strongyloides ratti]|uniref:Phospholipase D/Transphosphatidylase domain-containing protein n=1 Tax=Strongyloides ratti TaxID=34506 RepID=A0A090LL33_STRRB|nr:Phospholipase D/Transphosphatidylase domain-containing protein [Strongyloides ratti]CEF70425.1 Phospholipase D/Transphosphatidylase domain-containing protein [Strongyloides ratti]
MNKFNILVPIVTALITILLTSGIWIGAYYIFKPSNCNENNNNLTNKPISTTVVPSTIKNSTITNENNVDCTSSCEFTLVESIPYNLTYEKNETTYTRTYDVWKRLMKEAKNNINIASSYWTLLPNDTEVKLNYHPSMEEGIDIFNSLINTSKRGVKINVAENYVKGGNPDTIYLMSNGYANVRSLNFKNWFDGGILHTKAWIVDGKHFYVGSANQDWRSLTQVKELGVAAFNCPCLAADIEKIFDVYWQMGIPNEKIPDVWDDKFVYNSNPQNPTPVQLNNENSLVYFSSSPPAFCPPGRKPDGENIVDIINNAKSYVYIAVMDYIPATLYIDNNYYWPDIDDALRRAAFDRHVHVKLLMSKWAHTGKSLYNYLRSLADINGKLPCIYINYNNGTKKCAPNSWGTIEIKLFEVPEDGFSWIPYSRVNHNKYMVTESTVFIGTSNWSADYFINTGGIGFTAKSENIAINSSLNYNVTNNIFLRDWNSPYAKSIYDFDLNGDPYNNTKKINSTL